MKRIFLLVLALGLLSGCQTISNWKDAAALKAGYTSKVRAEQVLEQTKKDYDSKLAAKDGDIKVKQDLFIQSWINKDQMASDRLYGADFAFQLHPKPDRTHIIMDNRINEARVVLPPASVAAMAIENERVKRELDETRTSMAELQKNHDLAIEEAKLANNISEKAKADLNQAKLDKEKIEKDKNIAIAKTQEALDKANNEVIANEHKRGDDAKAIQAGKEKLSLGAGLLAALCLAGAIWSPIMKDKFGMAAGVLAVASVGVWYLTPILVFSIFGLGSLIIIGWVVFEHNKDNKAAVATYSALEEIKNNSKEVWDTSIAPKLSEWQSKYVVKDGKVITIPDPSIALNIDKKLAQTNQK